MTTRDRLARAARLFPDFGHATVQPVSIPVPVSSPLPWQTPRVELPEFEVYHLEPVKGHGFDVHLSDTTFAVQCHARVLPTLLLQRALLHIATPMVLPDGRHVLEIRLGPPFGLRLVIVPKTGQILVENATHDGLAKTALETLLGVLHALITPDAMPRPPRSITCIKRKYRTYAQRMVDQALLRHLCPEFAKHDKQFSGTTLRHPGALGALQVFGGGALILAGTLDEHAMKETMMKLLPLVVSAYVQGNEKRGRDDDGTGRKAKRARKTIT